MLKSGMVETSHVSPAFKNTLRAIGLTSGLAGGAFWTYTFYYIFKLRSGDGTGFQWIAEVPLTAIFVFSSLPAIVLSLFRGRKTAIAAALLGLVGLLAFGYIWLQLVSEFHK